MIRGHPSLPAGIDAVARHQCMEEIPSPRLLIEVPVSVGGVGLAPITIEPAEDKLWEVTAGEKLTIPLAADPS